MGTGEVGGGDPRREQSPKGVRWSARKKADIVDPACFVRRASNELSRELRVASVQGNRVGWSGLRDLFARFAGS